MDPFIDRATGLSSITRLIVNDSIVVDTLHTTNDATIGRNLNVNGSISGTFNLPNTLSAGQFQTTNVVSATNVGSGCIGEVRGNTYTFTNLPYGNYPTFNSISLTNGLWLITATLEFTSAPYPDYCRLFFSSIEYAGIDFWRC
jgi:hypothetical protein